MKKLANLLAFGVLLAPLGLAGGDDFAREDKNRDKKDPLEGKAPPALQVTGWMNTDGPLDLASLRGKVVVLDFWGTW